jgi:hypothetical protein
MRYAVLAALGLILAGCATAPTVDAPTALNGHELDTALSLYGPWDQRVTLQGRPHYVWRRAVVMNGHSYFCELRAEMGFRNTIKSSIVEGYPAACGLFSVQYSSGYDRTRTRLTAANGPAPGGAIRARNWRPVGEPTATASANGAAKDASARPRSADAGPGGSE